MIYLIFYENFSWTSDSALSEVGTVQIEMRDLSRVSGDKKYEVRFYFPEEKRSTSGFSDRM
jgi:hypothetical protein